MQITDEDVEKFMRLCLEERGIDLQPDEARAAVRRVLTLFEAFATWLAKERGTGRRLDDEPSHRLQETERH
jgi:hypothetical protein